MFSTKTSAVFTFYMVWGREKAKLNPIWPVRLKRISRIAIWIVFQTTYECSSERICTNWISCCLLLFRLFKYDRISIGFAQKSDLSGPSERGLMRLVFFLLEHQWAFEPGCKINTRQAPNASKNQRWQVHVTVSVTSWRVNFLQNITMQCSENNSQFLKRFTVSDISE